MKTRSIISKVLIIIGTICIVIAAVLFIQNQRLEKNARNYSEAVADEIMNGISDDVDKDIIYGTKLKLQDKEEVLIDGDLYIGILKFPTLGIELPVQSDWSYKKLRNTPCVYKNEPFSIAAHNYNAHFGRINTLEIGQQVIFMDVQGTDYLYKVIEVYKVHETDIEELQDEAYDLTLFTCNKSNNTERVVVRLEFVDSFKDIEE